MTPARKIDALCVCVCEPDSSSSCTCIRYVHATDLLRRVALRQPGELRWFLWDPVARTAVVDDAGRVRLVAQVRAAKWTRVELIPSA